MSIIQVLGILRARYLLILLTIAVSASTALLVVSFLPKTYRSTATLLLDVAAPDPVTGQMMPSGLVRSHIRTQIRLIKSERVATKVVQDLQLNRSTYFLNEFAKTDNAAEDLDYWISRQLIDNLDVRSVGGSEILSVSYVGNSPNITAQLVNAFVDAYIYIDLELRVDPAKRNAAWFSGQLNRLRQDLNDAQRRFTDFQQAKGLIAVSDEIDSENTNLVDLTQRLTASRTQASESRALLSQLAAYDATAGSTNDLPEILANDRLRGLRDQINGAEATLAAQSEQIGENHPQMVDLRARTAILREQFDEEVRKYRESLVGRVAIYEERASLLEKELNEQKDKILRARRDRDQLDALRREVDIRKEEYDAAFVRASTLRLEGDIGQSGVVVMEEAVPPLQHSFPKVPLAIGLALAGGMVFGVALAFLLEMIDRRVRSVKDLSQITEKPVFGALVSGKTARRPKLLPIKRQPQQKSPPKSLPAAAAE